MIAPPSFINERVTLQLQLMASRLGEVSLEALGFSVLREGNILEMVGEKLAVAEACSGIRSLMALIFLAVVYNFFFVPQKKFRVILLASVIPIAILCNAGRIVATGVVGQYNRELAHGMLHATFGYFGLALGLGFTFRTAPPSGKTVIDASNAMFDKIFKKRPKLTVVCLILTVILSRTDCRLVHAFHRRAGAS